MTTTNPIPTQPETLDTVRKELEYIVTLSIVAGESDKDEAKLKRINKAAGDALKILASSRAAVTAPRGDVATTARNRDVAQRVVMSTESVLGERFDIATRHELADRITAALDAATSSPTPAESDLGYEQWSRTDNWPISDVLNTLASATEHLLRDHNCDEQGHETWKYAAEAARKHVSLLAVPAERACLICGHNDLDADGITCAAPVPICSDDHHGLRHCGCKCKFTEQSYSEGFDDAARVARVLSNVATSDSARRAAEWRDEGGHVWEIRPNVDCVECPHCCFTFAAVHTDGYGDAYSCPNCKGCPDAAAPADNDAESSSVVEFRSACCSAPTRTATTDYNVCTACKEPCETTATTTKGDG